MSLFQDDTSEALHDKCVELAQAGSREDFTALYHHHKAGIHRYLAGIVGNGEDAHDLTQAAFLKAWEGLPSLHDISRFKPWLYRIARNLAYDRGRREGRASFQSWDSAPSSAIALGKPGPEESVAQSELIALALAEIPIHFRECLLLQIAGFSLGEIAQIVGISEESARTYVSNARRQFREVYPRLEREPDVSRKERGSIAKNVKPRRAIGKEKGSVSKKVKPRRAERTLKQAKQEAEETVPALPLLLQNNAKVDEK